MDGPGISEEHLQRLTGVPRATRQHWAKASLIDKQASPYSLGALRDIVVLCELRRALGMAPAEAVFRQLRAGLPATAQGPAPHEAIVDRHTLRAEWISNDDQITAAARRGNAIQLIDLTLSLARAQEGFDIAARAATAAHDELAKRRTRTSGKRPRTADPRS